MSAISLKSITGITSITTPAGVDNQLTLHNNNTTEAVKLDIAGNLHFHNHLNITGVSTASNFKTGTSNLHNTGLNVQDLDVDGHTNLDNVSIAGVTTVSNKTQVNSLGIGIQPIDHHHIHIESANPRILIRSTGTNASKILFGDNSSNDPGVIEYAHSSNSMMLNTGNLERLRITSAGDLSLRTTTQNAYLGLTANSTAINLTLGSVTGTNPRLYLKGVGNGQSDAGDVFIGAGTGGIVEIRSAELIKFEVNSDSSTAEALRIDSSGRVLIGTVKSTNNATHYDDLTINNSDQSGSAGSTGIDLIASNDAYGGIIFSDEDAYEQGFIKYLHNSDSDSLRFGTNSNPRWQMTKDGYWVPLTDSLYDIGTNSVRVRNIYTDNFYATSLSYDGNKLNLGGGSRTLDNGYYDDIVIDNSDTTSGEAGGSGISIISGNTSWGGLIFGDNNEHQRGYIKYAHEFDYMQFVAANGQVRIMSNGTVNIGGDFDQTTYNLSVTHSSTFLRLKDSNEGNYDLRFMIQNSEANIWHYGTDDFVFGNRYDRKLSFITNGQKRLTIHGSNIGINDTSPSYTLNVIGDNAASNGIGMLKGIIGVQNDTTAYGSYPTAGISFQTKYRTGPDVPLDVAAIYGGKENTTNGDKDGYMGFAVREEPGSGTQERMRITSDGNLIIGHTSGSNKLQIGNTGHSGYCIAANSPSYGAVIQVGDGATPGSAAALWIRNLNNGSGTESCFRVQGDATTHFGNQTSTTKYNDGVEGCSWYDDKKSWQQGQSGDIGWSMMYFNKKSGSDNRIMHFFNNGTTCGYIYRVTNNTTNYQTSSDYRLKKDIVALPNGIERVKKLRPVAFKFISDNADMEGFLAHEAQEIVPYAVSGKKDEVATEDFGDKKKGDMIVQGIDYGEFTPLLTAAMKELIAKVETLEAEVAALKGS